MLARLAAMGGAAPLYVDDVFSTYLYTGNGSTQTITNGIALADNGGMVWIKDRGTTGFTDNTTHDSARGATNYISTADTNPNVVNSGYVSAFNSNGFSVGNYYRNENTHQYVSWTFRKAPKFFDVVTYTGDGSSSRAIPHSIGVTPGMVVVKNKDSVTNWLVFHVSTGINNALYLNSTIAVNGEGTFPTTNTSSSFYVGGNANTNTAPYVAYLFAHDTSADGIVQCGSFTTDGSGNATVNHGWSAGVQFALIKCSSTTGEWEVYDTARTSAWSGNDARLRANSTAAEDSVSRLSASGTSVSLTGLSASATYIYMFIVAP